MGNNFTTYATPVFIRLPSACTAVGVGMDIIVCYGFQVHIGKTGEAHEQEHVAHGTLAFVSRFYMDYPLQFLFGRKERLLYSGIHSNDANG